MDRRSALVLLVVFGIGVFLAGLELIDVREPNEFEIVSIPTGKLIPKDEILSGRALSQLPNDKPIVLYCKTGVRSAAHPASGCAGGARTAPAPRRRRHCRVGA